MAQLAIHGGTHAAASLRIPRWPVTTEKEREALLAVLDSGQWCRLWAESVVGRFEEEWARFQDAKHCIAVGNGTESIELALIAAGVGYGDEVLVPAVTFIASASAIAEVGAVPVFVDSEPDTFAISAAAVEAAITPRTRAVVAVHYGGYPVDFDALLPVCRKHGIALIEDCAHAHGTEWRGRKVGAIGTAGSFSFQMSKSLASGEGGAVLTDDDALAERARLEHNIGRVQGRPGYEHVVLSGNYRMSEFQGAILRCQLERLPAQTEHKHANGEFLAAEAAKIGGIEPLKRDPRITKRGYYFFLLRYDAAQFGGVPRDAFLRALNAEGVPCGSAYGIPLYRNEAFSPEQARRKICCPPERMLDYHGLHLPVAERICLEQQVTIPHQALLADREGIQGIVDALAKITANLDELRAAAG